MTHNPKYKNTPQVDEWSGSPSPEAPDSWWVDDATGEYVNAFNGDRMSANAARAVIMDARTI